MLFDKFLLIPRVVGVVPPFDQALVDVSPLDHHHVGHRAQHKHPRVDAHRDENVLHGRVPLLFRFNVDLLCNENGVLFHHRPNHTLL